MKKKIDFYFIFFFFKSIGFSKWRQFGAEAVSVNGWIDFIKTRNGLFYFSLRNYSNKAIERRTLGNKC